MLYQSYIRGKYNFVKHKVHFKKYKVHSRYCNSLHCKLCCNKSVHNLDIMDNLVALAKVETFDISVEHCMYEAMYYEIKF